MSESVYDGAIKALSAEIHKLRSALNAIQYLPLPARPGEEMKWIETAMDIAQRALK